MPLVTGWSNKTRTVTQSSLRAHSTLCLEKVSTFKLSATLSNLNRFSKLLNFIPLAAESLQKFEFLISQGSVAKFLR